MKTGMKLREFDFNSIKRIGPTNLAVRLDKGKWYEGCSVGETLEMLPPHFADATIKEARWYFDTFVIELESETYHKDETVTASDGEFKLT